MRKGSTAKSLPSRAGRIRLFRAVKADELESIRRLGRFTNIPGIERKYFTLSTQEARTFAEMMQERFSDGPYASVRTSISTELLQTDCWATVDRGIRAVTIQTELLYALGRPEILGHI